MSNQISEVFGTPTPGASREEVKPQPAPAASAELPNADDVDAWKIPYGETVRTKQGIICSARPAPSQPRR